jgi:hypothetical protein
MLDLEKTAEALTLDSIRESIAGRMPFDARPVDEGEFELF